MSYTRYMLAALCVLGSIAFSGAFAETRDVRTLNDAPKDGPVVFKGPLAEETNAFSALAHWLSS